MARPTQRLLLSHFLLVAVLLIHLSISTGELSVTISDHNDSLLTAWYSITDDAEPTDLLGLLPGNASVATTSPLRYMFAESSLWTPNRRAAAEIALPNNGVDDLQLVHLRGSALFTNNLTAATPTAVLSSHPLPGSSSSRNTPTKCRLVFTRRPGEVRVLWRSKTPGSPAVKFRTASGSDWSQQFGSVGTFTAGDMCGAPAASSGFNNPQTINTAVLRRLQPNTTYTYKVGDEAHGFSTEHSFTTPPTAAGATDASPVRLLAAADLGTFSDDGAETVSAASLALQAKLLGRLAVPGSLEFTLIRAALTATGAVTPAPGSRGTNKQMQRLLAEKQHHGLLLLGGLSMAAGQAAGWDDFLEQLQPVLSQVPLAAAAGDTESADHMLRGQVHNSSASGGECGVAYEQLLRMPHAERLDQWWATNIGPVHLLMLNSDQNLTRGSPQYNFLESDLRAVDRSITPWVIIGMHRGLYVDDPATQQAPDGAAHIAVTLREQLEPLLAERQVDLVLSGHGRKFHRSCPVMKGVCVGFDDEGAALGPVHVMLGSAGAAVPLSAWAVQPEWMDEAPVFEHSFAQLAISRTTLELKVISSRTGKALSQLLLKKPRHWTPDPEAAEQLYANAVARPELRGTNTSALVELLQEDVVAAALATPSQQPQQVFGPDGPLAGLLSSLPMADAPSVAASWQVTSQLMQLVLAVMGSNPAAAAAGAQPTSLPVTTAPAHPAEKLGSSGLSADTAAHAKPPVAAGAVTAARSATALRLDMPPVAALPPAVHTAPLPPKPAAPPLSAAAAAAAGHEPAPAAGHEPAPAAGHEPAPAAGVAPPGLGSPVYAGPTSPLAGPGAVPSAPASMHQARPLKLSPEAGGPAVTPADRKPLPGKAPSPAPATKHGLPSGAGAAAASPGGAGASASGVRPAPQAILAVKAKPKLAPSFVAPPAASHPQPAALSQHPAGQQQVPSAATKVAQPPPQQGAAKHKPVPAPKVASKQATEAVGASSEMEVVELPTPAAAADDAGWLVWAPPARRLKAQQISHGAGAADALQAALQARMVDSLVLRKADGTPLPADKVEAFVYHWLLLQGRLQGLKGSPSH